MFQSKQPQFERKQWIFMSANVCAMYEKGREKNKKEKKEIAILFLA